MGKKSSHWLGSIVSVFLIAIVLFLLIYFFAPNMSLRFFGIAYGREAQVSTALQEFLVEKFDIEPEKAAEYLSSENGQRLVDSAVENIKNGIDNISNIISPEEIKEEIEAINGDTTEETLDVSV